VNFQSSRKNPYTLIIAPETSRSSFFMFAETNSSFKYYFDDGDSINPSFNSSMIEFTHKLVTFVNKILYLKQY
jgi:hypothetical protein